jgi:two-component system, LytTR family, sensor histidine kinase AlgZ
MHPILKDRRFLSLYLLVWLALAIMLGVLLALPRTATPQGVAVFILPMMLVYAFVSLSSWYVGRAFPLQPTNAIRLVVINLAAAVLSCSLWLGAGFGWMLLIESLVPGLVPEGWLLGSMPLLGASGVVLFLLASAVHYLLAALETSRIAEKNALELRVLAREAELKALRAQIDPHFLFNSLNSVSALTATDPRLARTMTVKLAEFLRLSLSYGALDTITLDQELSLVSRFLDIEKVRFGGRLVVEQAVDEDSRECRIAPLLLQPLVENAVGHGIACLVNGGTILIRGARVGTRLQVTVANPAEPGRRKNTGTGVGLDNVRRRLRGLYGQEARMEIADEPETYTVTLTFPAEQVDP